MGPSSRRETQPRMGDRRRIRLPSIAVAAPPALALVLVLVPTIGCASRPPVRAIRAARHYSAGTRALDRGDAVGAIAELERAVVLMPDASEIHNHLGLAYWSDARNAEALRELERAVELDCDNDEARVNLALFRATREARSADPVRRE